MSADLSPLEKLHDAVREFFEATGCEGELNGFIVAVEHKQIQFDDDDALPVTDSNTYAFGPTTSVSLAAGLAQYIRVVTEQQMWRLTGDEE